VRSKRKPEVCPNNVASIAAVWVGEMCESIGRGETRRRPKRKQIRESKSRSGPVTASTPRESGMRRLNPTKEEEKNKGKKRVCIQTKQAVLDSPPVM